MGRFLFLGSVSICLNVGAELAHAQSAAAPEQTLPPIVVTRPAPVPQRAQPPRRQIPNLPRTVRHVQSTRPLPTAPKPAEAAPIQVLYPTTPGSTSGISVDRVPASVSIVDSNQIERT